jgi:hypothetical protein
MTKDNRMVWGAMIALGTIAPLKPDALFTLLPKLTTVADAGTVITNDHLMGILVTLAKHPTYANEVYAQLIIRLEKSPSNQLPAYAEKVLPVVTHETKDGFLVTLQQRVATIEPESKLKRVEKVIAKAQKLKPI